MIRFLFFLLICNGWLSHLSAQVSVSGPCGSLLIELMEPQLTGELYELVNASMVSPYFSVNWLKGDIELAHGRIVKDQYLKYNGFFDQLIWLQEEDFLQVRLDKEPILSFRLYDNQIPGKTYLFEKIRMQEDPASDSFSFFAQVLHSSKLSLYVQRKVIRNGTEEKKSDEYIAESFKKRNIYYFKSGKQVTKGFRKINRKSIMNTFPERKEDIVKLFRSDKRNRLKTEEDLIRFTVLLNGMFSQQGK